tara:strand:- start:950 stop:1654 length:705 start_codon:yes stop_codon:yes gene_type:complete
MTLIPDEKVDLTEDPGVGPESFRSVPDRLREDIISGVFPADGWLKTQELSQRYAVSTNPIREALHQLSGEGFVNISRHRGARVRSLDEAFVRNIFDIRTMIEPYLIRVFVEQASPEDIEAARRFQSQLERVEGDQVEWDRLDEAFHGVMYNRHFNTEALAIRQRHGQVVRALARRYPINPARRRNVIQDHCDILKAVEAGMVEEAVAVVERHARGAERHLLISMRQQTVGIPRA